jgi:hypothetical protein
MALPGIRVHLCASVVELVRKFVTAGHGKSRLFAAPREAGVLRVPTPPQKPSGQGSQASIHTNQPQSSTIQPSREKNFGRPNAPKPSNYLANHEKMAKKRCEFTPKNHAFYDRFS